MQNLGSSNFTNPEEPAVHLMRFMSADSPMQSEAANEGLSSHRKDSRAPQSRRSKRIPALIALGLGWLAKTAAKALVSWGVTSLLNKGQRDKNEKYIQETFNAISKNYDAIQRNYEAIRGVHNEVRKNTRLLVDILNVSRDTRKAIQDMRDEMREKFGQVLESIRDARVLPVVTSLKSFVQYFLREKELISSLTDNEYLAKVREESGFLLHLKASRSPSGDSLRTSLFAVMDQGFAVPRDADDSTAFSALFALYYGAQTYASVMLFLLEQYSRLADLCYQEGDLDGYNKNFDLLQANFKSFKHSLVGTDGENSFIGNVIEILKGVRDKDFIQPFGENSFWILSRRVKSLAQLELQIRALGLPVLDGVPGKISGKPTFPEDGVRTPLGDWVNGATVRYAIQYRMNDRYSKIGDWSRRMTVREKANPVLKISVDAQGRDRLVFRQFNDELPQLVGVLETKNRTQFRDIDRDLFNAAHSFDASASEQDAETLIRHGADVDAVFENGMRAIHAAAQSDNVRLARDLLIRGNASECDVKDARGQTPLHMAAEAGNSGFVEMLVEAGADVNAQLDGEGLTPLHVAVYKGFPSTVTALLKSDAIDLNARDSSGFTALHGAVFGGYDVLRALMSMSLADVNAKSTAGLTPLHVAAVNNFVDVAQILLQDDHTDPNEGAEGNLTALHFASIAGNVEVVEFLLGRSDVDVNVGSVFGWTPLHFAISLQKEEVAAGLLNCNRTDAAATATNGVTPLHLAAGTGQTRVLATLIGKGSIVDQVTEDGMTALHFATMNGHREAVTALLDHSANIDAISRNGSTPLHLASACPQDSLDTIEYLLLHGADISAVTNSGGTCLHMAARAGNIGTIKYFLRRGIDIDAQDSTGYRPLHIAAQGGHLGAVQYLVEKGAVFSDTSIGETVLHLAALSGHLDLVKFVARNGRAGIVNRKDGRGFTPLHLAYNSHGVDSVKYLVEVENADVNIKFAQGESPLHRASSSGDIDLVDIFVRNGADCCAKNDRGVAPLLYAAKNGHQDVVEYLVEVKKLYVLSACNYFARPTAAYFGHLKIVEYLGSKEFSGAPKPYPRILSRLIGINRFLSLLFAVSSGHLDAVKQLIHDENIDIPVSDTFVFKFSSGPPPFDFLSDDFVFQEIQGFQFGKEDIGNWVSFITIASLLKEDLNVSTKNVICVVLCLVAGKKHRDALKLVTENMIIDVNKKYSLNLTLLHLFAFTGNLGMVQYLTDDRHANFDVEDDNGMTPLLVAAQHDHLDVVEHLVDKGALLTSSKSISPLLFAAANGNIAMYEYFVSKGSDVNSSVSGFTVRKNEGNFQFPSVFYDGRALSNAARFGHLSMVKYLTERGANITSGYERNYTPLHAAAENGHLGVLKYLVEESRANVEEEDDKGRKPLDLAIEKGHLDTVAYLKRGDADTTTNFEEAGRDASTTPVPSMDRKLEVRDPLILAYSSRGDLAAVKYLAENGANVHYKDERFFSGGQSALHLAAQAGHLDIIKYLVEERGAAINAKDNYLWTPLHFAAREGYLEIVQYLVGVRGVNPDIEGADKDTPLMCALRKGHKNVAKYLIRKGVSCRIHSHRVCLEEAFRHDMFDVARHLILKGAGVNEKLFSTLTPLHFAVRNGSLDMVQFLLAKGATVDATGTKDASLFQEAKLLCHTAIAHLLETKLIHRNRRSISLDDSPPAHEHAPTVKSSGPASVGSGRPSSWMDSLAHTALDAFAGLSHVVSSPFRAGVSGEQPAPHEVATPHLSDPQGSLFLLDVVVRKWTGQKRVATEEVDMTSREAMRIAASTAGKIMDVLRRAASHSGIALHRLDIDVTDVMSVVGRKIVGGRFNDIADELVSLVEEACPRREVGCPGRLSPKKFESFLHEIARGFKATLGEEMMKVLHSRRDGSKMRRIGRRNVGSEPKGYIENGNARDMINPAENQRKPESLL